MGYSICISTPRPAPGDRHFDTGPRGFHFHPGPCIQFSGVERSATPSGPDNVPRRRQSDTGPLRSGPPKAGDRPSRHAGTPAGIPGSAGVSGNRNRVLTAVTGDLPANGLGPGRGAGPVSHSSRIATDQWKPDSSSQGPALRSPGCHPPPLIFALGNGTAAIWLCRGHRRPLASVIRRDATGGKSSNTVAATNIGDGSERPIHLTSGQCTFGSMAACSTAVPAHGNGSGQARLEEPLYEIFFVGGSGPARSAPAVKPSAQPFSPPPRSTARSAHQPMWPNRRPASPPPIPDPRRCLLSNASRESPAGRRKSLGRENPRPGFEAPGAGLPHEGPTPRTPEQRDT